MLFINLTSITIQRARAFERRNDKKAVEFFTIYQGRQMGLDSGRDSLKIAGEGIKDLLPRLVGDVKKFSTSHL